MSRKIKIEIDPDQVKNYLAMLELIHAKPKKQNIIKRLIGRKGKRK